MSVQRDTRSRSDNPDRHYGMSATKLNLGYDWPYQISIDLRKSPKPKIAFWSGMEREYYPEKPGHTRMGVEFAMNCAPGDVPNPSYYPSPLGVTKPISLLGFGIGGLLGPRFSRDLFTDTPDPGQYQNTNVTPRTLQGHMMPPDINDQILRWQCRIGFGSANTVSRFGIERFDVPPGPGSYEVMEMNKCPSVKREEAFGSKRRLLPAVVTVCIVDGGEKCCECGEVQLADYYRSKRKLRHPEKKRASILAICRKCYCRAWNGHFPYWVKGDLSRMFEKARHCNYIHDHQKLHQFMHKTTCKDVKKLTMKEVVLNKYYKDCCPPEFNFGGKSKA
ncbi:unnamed protein product [Allacma fusca]|uniref:Uncharacterized protein n=1 Tax=Allacma fusca TaxID=39272 RepID=A0A8J2K8H4_9HEXA|nr:unnamed protein product [Allacma fusca]